MALEISLLPRWNANQADKLSQSAPSQVQTRRSHTLQGHVSTETVRLIRCVWSNRNQSRHFAERMTHVQRAWDLKWVRWVPYWNFSHMPNGEAFAVIARDLVCDQPSAITLINLIKSLKCSYPLAGRSQFRNRKKETWIPLVIDSAFW